jgi:hypothetical protein
MFIASLYLDWPVSSIVLWESQEVHVCDELNAQKRTAWMLDGQQQIMALCKVMDKESGLKVVFNPRVTDMKKGSEGQFRAESPITRKSAGWIDVGKVLGSREDFCTVLDEEPSKEYRIRLIRLREILNKKMSVHKFTGCDYTTIVNAFMTWKMMRHSKRKSTSISAAP